MSINPVTSCQATHNIFVLLLSAINFLNTLFKNTIIFVMSFSTLLFNIWRARKNENDPDQGLPKVTGLLLELLLLQLKLSY